jgi:predicted ribosomally synthesized peptide with SipW-like signal peptide
MDKKVTYSTLLIAVVAVGAIAGTFAYFTATRTTEANRFAAGTLDLDVASNGNVLEPFVIENMGENANISGTKTWTVENTGSLPGRFFLRLQNVVNEENGCNDQEKAIEPACDADNEGELGDVITLNVALDGVDQVASTLATADQASIGSAWALLPEIILAPGEVREVTAYWSADEDSYGNEIQGDSTQFDMNFRLIQQIDGEFPAN